MYHGAFLVVTWFIVAVGDTPYQVLYHGVPGCGELFDEVAPGWEFRHVVPFGVPAQQEGRLGLFVLAVNTALQPGLNYAWQAGIYGY